MAKVMMQNGQNLSSQGFDSDIVGYMALFVSIIAYVTPDEAFGRLDGNINPNRTHRKWSEEDVRTIDAMRDEGMTWREVADVYGKSPTTVFRMYTYWKEKMNDA